MPDAIAIGVPARNEVARLPRLLDAFARQRNAPAFTLCLFFDNCDDGSAELVARLAGDLPFAVAADCCSAGGPPNAGAARSRAMALALRHAPGGVLLTTDADGEPAPDWIAANLAALARADIVAGRIVRRARPEADGHDRLGAYLDRLHALRRALDPVPWDDAPGHHWTSGASLACRAATYRALGGFAARASGEDAAFGDAAARAGYRLRRDAGVVVRTSSRRVGRAERGFAAALGLLDIAGRLPRTAHPADEAWRYRRHAEARAAYRIGAFHALAAALALPSREVAEVAAECVNAEAFAARIVGAPPGGMRGVGLAQAEARLATLASAPAIAPSDELAGAA